MKCNQVDPEFRDNQGWGWLFQPRQLKKFEAYTEFFFSDWKYKEYGDRILELERQITGFPRDIYPLRHRKKRLFKAQHGRLNPGKWLLRHGYLTTDNGS